MNINQILDNPSMITTLTPNQRLQVYQDLKKYKDTLNNQLTKAQTQLELKQQEQQQILQQLQQLTGKETIQDIKQCIDSLQQDFDQQFNNILSQYSEIHKQLP